MNKRKVKSMPKGLLFEIYQSNGPSCTNGPSRYHTEAILVGPEIDEIFDSEILGLPVFYLVENGEGMCKLVPADTYKKKWLMFGGNFGYTSDSRFREAIRKLIKAPFHGAVCIHDRYED